MYPFHAPDTNGCTYLCYHLKISAQPTEAAAEPPVRDVPSTAILINPATLQPSNNSSTSLSPMAASVKLRHKVLSDLFRTADVIIKSAPVTMELRFTQQPQSLTDVAPDPTDTAFVGACHWLSEQRQYVEGLEPLGNQDVDSRRLALLGKLNLAAERLEGAKQRAWNKCLADWFLRERMSGKSGAHFVKCGE